MINRRQWLYGVGIMAGVAALPGSSFGKDNQEPQKTQHQSFRLLSNSWFVLDKRQPNDIKRNVPLAFEPRAEVALLAFRLAHRSRTYGNRREENHSCAGETSLRPEQFWEQ
jgi:hypothetical protein